MGGIASELADISVITSDNPRSEDPQTIIDEIVAGSNGGRAQVSQIVDRREAIRHALEAAQPGDLVVVAGKGHETYQIFADRTIHFDDREVVRELLADLRHGRG
jgi:UDP-N-acetylmuramoyl-L-alanyl-D-glutamate--2,6-diaminopimelate ligase